KAFGFPNVIAHGMWTAGTLLSAVEGGIPERARYSVEFGKPVVLPAKLGVYARRGGAGGPAWDLTVRNPRKLGTVHATATIEELYRPEGRARTGPRSPTAVPSVTGARPFSRRRRSGAG